MWNSVNKEELAIFLQFMIAISEIMCTFAKVMMITVMTNTI